MRYGVYLPDPVPLILLGIALIQGVALVLKERENNFLRRILNQKLDTIMDNAAQAQTDIATILAAVTTGATAVTAIGQEITNLKAQITGQIPDAVVAQLDDLATRASALGTNLQALVPPTTSGTGTGTGTAAPAAPPAQ